MKGLFVIKLAVLFIIAGDIAEAAFRDQYQNKVGGAGYFWSERYYAQTFTPGMEGQLDHVNIYCNDVWGTPNLTTLSVVETIGGKPTDLILGGANLPYLTRGWVTFDFTDKPVNLSKDTQYAIILSNNDPTSGQSDSVGIQWHDNLYIGGGLWRWGSTTGWQEFNPYDNIGDSDMAFETWMVPEPATLLLLGLSGLILRKRNST